MKPGGLFSKLFMGSYFFTIALREKTPLGITGDRSFCAQTVLPATKEDWAADPILAEDDGHTWLFYEAVKNGKGRIQAAEILDGCRLSEPTVVLEDSCHYSYPFVFRAQGEWYMIPESSAAKEVRLYRAKDFPFGWEQQAILLNERAVDTTVFEHDGVFWLLTFLLDNESERVYPRAFKLVDFHRPELIEAKWPDFDPLRVRGAGPVFRSEDKLLRPAQISMEQRYGDGLVFYSVCPSDQYQEEELFEFRENNLKIRGYWVDGVHTFSSSQRYEAIDIRCREPDPWKILRRIKRK